MDFDCDENDAETGYAQNLNGSSDPGLGTLTDSDDWPNLYLLFQETTTGADAGRSQSDSDFWTNKSPIRIDSFSDERHAIHPEEPISEKYLEQIRKITGG